MDNVCRNDGKRYGFSCFRERRPRYEFPSYRIGSFRWVWLFLPSPTGRGNKLQRIATIVEFQLSDALSPWEREQIAGNHNNGRTSVIWFPLSVGEGANCKESQQWSDFSYPIPSPRGRGLGRGQSCLERRYPDFQKPPFKTDTDKRDGRAWMSDLIT